MRKTAEPGDSAIYSQPTIFCESGRCPNSKDLESGFLSDLKEGNPKASGEKLGVGSKKTWERPVFCKWKMPSDTIFETPPQKPHIAPDAPTYVKQEISSGGG